MPGRKDRFARGLRMKVYVVLYQCDSWQGESRFGIFSSPDKAQAAIEAREAAKHEASKMVPILEPLGVLSIAPVEVPKATAPPIALDTTPDRVRLAAPIRRRPKCDAVFCF